MELARPQVDVGIFTNNIEELKAFYGETLGLAFESLLPVGGGFRQHRYLANGSVIKLMESREPLPRRHPGGYETLIIATPKTSTPEALTDPDGNKVVIVPPGQDDVTQIEVRVGVTDIDASGPKTDDGIATSCRSSNKSYCVAKRSPDVLQLKR